MTREPIEVTRQDRIYCLKASSDYHSEVCEECRFYPNCDHMTQDDLTELTIKDLEALEQEPKILNTLDFAIDASNGGGNYFVGFRNGLRYAKSLIDGEEEPQFESCTEQEPCEDCVSRQTLDEIKELMADINGDTVYAVRMSDLRQLPSVTPQPKMGKWINKYAEDACGERYSYWACSECGRDVGFNLANIEDVLSDYPYCHCGAKMVESQESEG